MPLKKKKNVKPADADASGARSRIFEAALKEFAVQGLAGARTDSIAKAADVNIALLFYYFKSKEELYAAVLEQMFSTWASTLLEPLRGPGTAEERILNFVRVYFDHVAKSVWKPRLVQQEFMRSKHSAAMKKMLKKYAKPVFENVIQVLRDGISSGDFRDNLDVENFYYSMTGIVAQYFSNSSAIMEITGKDPLSAERIRARRAAVLDVITAALLVDKKDLSGSGTSE